MKTLLILTYTDSHNICVWNGFECIFYLYKPKLQLFITSAIQGGIVYYIKMCLI